MTNILENIQKTPVIWKSLGEVAEIANTARKPVKASLRIAGKIPYYGANNIQDYVAGFTHDGEYVLIAEDGSASLENYSIQWVNGKFWANNHVHVVRGKHILNNRFLFHYLSQLNFVPYLSGGTRAKLTKAKLLEIFVPIPPLELQREIVRVLDTFTALIAELEKEQQARQKQYAFYRDFLLSADNLHGAAWLSLGELVTTVTAPVKLKTKSYALSGKLPIIDQGEKFIAGYTDEDFEPVSQGEYVIFGDHSEHIKYVDFPFVQGADGLKILRSKHALAKYIFYAFKNFYQKEQSYKRHWAKAKQTQIPIPSLDQQAKIVDILDRFEMLANSLAKGLPREIELRKKQYEYYREQLLNFAPA